MHRHRMIGTLTVFALARSAAAAPPPATSLNNCQNAVKRAAKAFVTNKVAAIGTCLQAVSTQIVKSNAADAHAAASTCVSQFRKIKDTRGQGKQLSDKLTAAVAKKCDPTYQTSSGGFPNTHTVADIIGSGAGVAQPLDAENLNAWCTHYGGDGSIDTLPEWIGCITAAAECDVDSAIASQYPRAIEWLNLVKPSMQGLAPPGTDPTKISDAVAGLDAVKADLDGPDNDNLVSIQCGGIVSSGTAVASDCLTGTTFSNDTAAGLTGTMPNNGAVMLTPSTTDQTIALGYHNGSGKCLGDADLVAGNIKSGVNLFGVTGSVIQASGNAAAGDVLSGKTFSNASGAATGTMPDNGAVTLTPGTADQTIAAGYHNGGGKCAGDADLVASNVVSGVNLFGVSGTARLTQLLKTGQTSTYGTGSDGDLQKGVARSYTDNSDGTITDNRTGLMWEKKSDDGSIHDKDNEYSWGMTSSPYTMNGTMVTAFLATLNAAAGFAGHTDWRIPNVNELESIANYQNFNPAVDTAFNTGCVASCTVTSCSCTTNYGYWSSSTRTQFPGAAHIVYFEEGDVNTAGKSSNFYVRAVRGGL